MQADRVCRRQFVADIKKKYIDNIAQQAENCHNISRIVLFGSALETRCRERSDIDIAVFGKKKHNDYLRSGEFKQFQRSIFSFGGDYTQDDDILYFCDDTESDDAILENIHRGTEIYRRAQ